MSYDAHANFSYSSILTAPVPAVSGTSIVVQSGDGAKFPAAPFNVTIWPAGQQPTTTNAEIARVTNISVDTFTITRATELPSVARTIVVGDQIAATLTKKSLTDIENSIQQFPFAIVTLTDGATPALDASLGGIFLLTAAGNRTIAVPSNPVSGQKIIIRHKASGADRTLALNTGTGGFRFGTDISALTATTSAKTDYIGCIYNLADNVWDVVAVTKNF